jgi:ribosomal protein S18 acetylase RimI-like enzyme
LPIPWTSPVESSGLALRCRGRRAGHDFVTASGEGARTLARDLFRQAAPFPELWYIALAVLSFPRDIIANRTAVVIIRETHLHDIDSLFSVRERTRENAVPRERLAAIGITPASVAARLEAGQLISYVCEDGSSIVGFCSGDPTTGEVLVLAVLPAYEGRGVGKELLGRVVGALRDAGQRELWLAASADAKSRAHGFYRAQGWRASGTHDENGDEILLLATEG